MISSVELSPPLSLSTLRSIIGTRSNLQQNMQNLNLHRFCVCVSRADGGWCSDAVGLPPQLHYTTTHDTVQCLCVCVWSPLAVMFAFTCVNYQEWPGNKNNATKKYTHLVMVASKERAIGEPGRVHFCTKSMLPLPSPLLLSSCSSLRFDRINTTHRNV